MNWDKFTSKMVNAIKKRGNLGVTVAEMQKIQGGWGFENCRSAVHNFLIYLYKKDIITRKKDGKAFRYFAKTESSKNDRTTMSKKESAIKKIFEHIQCLNGVTSSELKKYVEKKGIYKPSSIGYVLRTLYMNGDIKRTKGTTYEYTYYTNKNLPEKIEDSKSLISLEEDTHEKMKTITSLFVEITSNFKKLSMIKKEVIDPIIIEKAAKYDKMMAVS
jgi:predicted transcriptional regulator